MSEAAMSEAVMSRAVWVVVQHREGQLHRMSREAITAAQRLAAIDGASVSAVVLGHDTGAIAEQVAGFDLERVLVVDDQALAGYTPGAYVGALTPLISGASPALVVFPHTYQSVDFVARLSQALDVPLVPEVTAFEHGDDGLLWHRPVLGGKLQAKVRVRGEGTVLVTVQSGAFSATEAATGSAEREAVSAGELVADREILGVEQVGGDAVDLTKADVIVAVGRGIGKAENMPIIEALAAALGADIGASRPVIDNGWLPRDRQIGSSGQTVAPKLYFAIGISGAIQHLVGMKGSTCVVAINKDANAPIFTVAKYGMVGDLHEIVPAITAAVEAAG